MDLKFRTVGELERYLLKYISIHKVSVVKALSDNKEVILNSTYLFRMSHEECKKLMKDTYRTAYSKDQCKYSLLYDYLKCKISAQVYCKSIRSFKNFKLGGR